MSRKRTLLLPALLGLITFALILLALWPEPVQETTFIVAARDLGAGAALTEADLATRTLPADQAPPDAVSDPAPLVGQTLAVARFQSEAITRRHLGPAVALAPDERAVAVRVSRDRGLAGLLRPGARVGVVATLPAAAGELFAKAVIENLRVLYVSPDFQARPEAPVTAQMTVAEGESSGLVTSPGVSAASQTPAREGVLLLAAPIAPQPIAFVPISQTVPSDVQSPRAEVETSDEPELLTEATPTLDPSAALRAGLGPGTLDFQNAQVLYASPVELLAALNGEKDALSLYLMPQDAEPLYSDGFSLSQLLPPAQEDAP